MVRALLHVACCSAVAFACSGCASGGLKTTQPSALTSWFRPKPKIEEPPPIQVPDKLVDERDLTLKYARWMVETGRLKEASEKYQSVLKKNPKDVEAIIGLARIDELTDRKAEAEAGYLKAVQIAPDAAIPQRALGDYFASQKRWPEAIDCYNRAVLADPIDKNARFELAKALVHNGDIEGALPHFIRTVGDARAHYDAALILREDGRLKDAEHHLRVAVAKDPQLTQAKMLLAEMTRPQRRGLTHDPEFQRASHSEPYDTARGPVVNPGPVSMNGAHSAAGTYAMAGYNQ
jgi:tetratricopeptide (TPR) repeat protein